MVFLLSSFVLVWKQLFFLVESTCMVSITRGPDSSADGNSSYGYETMYSELEIPTFRVGGEGGWEGGTASIFRVVQLYLLS